VILVTNGWLTTGDIIRGALGQEPGKWERGAETRIGKAMTRLKEWEKRRPTIHGLRTWAFRKKGAIGATKNT
jgi:hypothetical protein